ncbi:hypothetical protein NPIL_7591 [Nephila pilipes]|uniref:Uncharacterized protein n=1 Tax=Nephila pilipes TaxID=299642 RepID=A0A8X6PBP4_NEPPI|nr:hypothetical protein NPIL_7591 [Nephila pilipes]
MASGRISGFVEEDRKQMARPPERRRPHETTIVTSHRHRFLARRGGNCTMSGKKDMTHPDGLNDVDSLECFLSLPLAI